MRVLMDENKSTLEQWAKDNNVELKEILPERGRHEEHHNEQR